MDSVVSFEMTVTVRKKQGSTSFVWWFILVKRLSPFWMFLPILHVGFKLIPFLLCSRADPRINNNQAAAPGVYYSIRDIRYSSQVAGYCGIVWIYRRQRFLPFQDAQMLAEAFITLLKCFWDFVHSHTPYFEFLLLILELSRFENIRGTKRQYGYLSNCPGLVLLVLCEACSRLLID
jgi:hypothetical protein